MRRAALLALLLLAACGGDDDSTATDGTSASSTATTAAPTSTTAGASTTTTTTTTTTAVGADGTTSTTEDLTGEGIGDVEAVLPELLIAPAELVNDPPFEDAGYTPGQIGHVCADIDAAIPPAAVAGTSLRAADRLVVEELRAYDTVDDAVAAITAARAGPACTAVVDVTEGVGGDETFTATVEEGAVIVGRVADVVIATFLYGPDPDVDIAAYAIGKVAAVIEAGAGPGGG